MALFSTAGLARGSARHPWLMILLWIVFIAGAVVAQGNLDDALGGDDSFTNNPDAKQGADLINDRLRGSDPMNETVIVRSETATVDDPAFKAEVEQTTATLLGFTDGVASATSYYDLVAAGDSSAEQLVSADRHTTIIPVTLHTVDDEMVAEPEEYVDLVETLGSDGYEVYSVGSATADVTFGEIVSEDIAKGEMVGIPIAIVVLIVVFGALVAVGLPLILALVSIFIAVGLAALVGQVIPLEDTVISLITMIGLAVGIDYALFVVERYREERRRGIEKRDAIERAGASASKAVLFSGVTVIIALLGMFLIPVTVFQGLGIGAALVVIVAVFASLTLIPAMLSILGDKIDWPRRKRKDAVRQSAHDPAAIYRGFWGRITRVVMARPAISAILAIAVLVGAAWSATDLKTGEPGLNSLPDSDLKTGYEIISTEFYAGLVDPVEIVIDGPANDPATQAGVTALVDALAQDPLYGPATIESNDAGDLTLVSVPMSLDANDPAAETEIKQLREETIPTAFDGIDAEVYVTGDAAFNRDFNTILSDYTPIVFAFVLGLSFLLLMVAFRSIVVPLKAIVLNLLSVGAAYGLLVLVFQKGYGADLLGLQESPVITAWIPIFLFCILFGLSMDYHVFLLSRIREHYDLTKRNRESVAFGLHATAKIITGAAVIMVAVFWGFASGRLVDMQQMGFGLAVAVLIDATIVRSILVPASMALLGKWNWYLPRWLEWLPDLRVEGPAEPELPEAAPGAASAGSAGTAPAAGLAGHGLPAGHFGHAPASGHAFHGSMAGHLGHLGHQGSAQTLPGTPPSFQTDPKVAYTSYPPTEQPAPTYAATMTAPVTAQKATQQAPQPAREDENRFLRMIAVPFEGRTYMSIAYLLLSLPLGIAYFTFLIVGFAVGLGSLMVVLGVPVLFLTISLAWKFMSLERHLAGSVLGQSIPAPFTEADHQPSFWSRLKARLLHPSTYKGIAFLLAKLPIGIVSFALTTFAVSIPVALALSLATFPFEDARMDFMGMEIDTIQEAFACTILAPLVILVALHLLNAAAGLFARLARGAVGGAV